MITVKLLLILAAVLFFVLEAVGVVARVKWTPLAFACITLALWVV